MPLSPGAEHDFHLAGGSFARVEHDQRLADRFVGVPLGRAAVEVVETDATAAARAAGLALAAGLHDDAHAEAQEGLAIEGQLAIGSGHEDLADLLAQRGVHAHDARVGGAGALVGPLEQRALVEPGNVETHQGHRRNARRSWATQTQEPLFVASPRAMLAAVWAARTMESKARSST